MKKGFTLVELLIVISIIALLSAIAIPSFLKSKEESERQKKIANEFALEEKSILLAEISQKVELEKSDVVSGQLTKEKLEMMEKSKLIDGKIKQLEERRRYSPERLFYINGYDVYRAYDERRTSYFYFTVPSKEK